MKLFEFKSELITRRHPATRHSSVTVLTQLTSRSGHSPAAKNDSLFGAFLAGNLVKAISSTYRIHKNSHFHI